MSGFQLKPGCFRHSAFKTLNLAEIVSDIILAGVVGAPPPYYRLPATGS